VGVRATQAAVATVVRAGYQPLNAFRQRVGARPGASHRGQLGAALAHAAARSSELAERRRAARPYLRS